MQIIKNQPESQDGMQTVTKKINCITNVQSNLIEQSGEKSYSCR